MQNYLVKGRQSTLGEVVTLCANLITQAFFLVKSDHNAQNRPLVVDFLTQTADMLVTVNF